MEHRLHSHKSLRTAAVFSQERQWEWKIAFIQLFLWSQRQLVSIESLLKIGEKKTLKGKM